MSNVGKKHQEVFKKIVLQRVVEGSCVTFECDRCRGSMVKDMSKYTCLNCDRVLVFNEVTEQE